MRRLLGGGKAKGDAAAEAAGKGKDAKRVASPAGELAPAGPRILVIDSEAHDWAAVFGAGVQVEQAEWEALMVVAEGERPTVHLRGRRGAGGSRSVVPDAVLVRKLVRGLTPRDYHTNALYGLLASGVPAVNSLHSIRLCLERPVVARALHDLARRMGDAFPLLPLCLHTDLRLAPPPAELPAVLKVSSAEAGYGKMRVATAAAWEGLDALVSGTGDYATVERFVGAREYDIRVQRVGRHVRAYHRQSANWKGNVGSSHLTEVPPTDDYRRWAEACAGLFGGVDILTVDAIHTADGRNCACAAR